MKVLIVSRGLPQPDNPTFGIFELDQAKALTKQGIDVTFFAVDLRSIRRKRKYGVVKTLHEELNATQLVFRWEMFHQIFSAQLEAWH